MLNIAPLNYELYAALVGPPVPVPVEGHLGAKPLTRQTKAVSPVSVELNRRQPYSTQKQVESFNFTPSENRETAREPIFVVDQNLTDLSWLAEDARNAGDTGNRPSTRKVSDLYGTLSEKLAQTIRLLA